jgi:hypothetical protein
MKIRAAIVLTLATLPLSMLAASQAANVSGSWTVDATAAEGEANGNKWSLGALSGRLTLEQQGDAVTGSWQGRQPQPWTLTGRVTGTEFELQTESREIPAIRNGEQTTVPRHWIFRGAIDGDTLSGSMSLAGGDGDTPTQAFSAARQRQ